MLPGESAKVKTHRPNLGKALSNATKYQPPILASMANAIGANGRYGQLRLIVWLVKFWQVMAG